jgi:signal transduction histidine kinase
VPIIFVTAGMQERHRVFKGYDAGAVDFLFKPLEPQILRHKTETFFQLHRQRQELAETLRLNEELMAVVGHDLRNPLNVVLMTTRVLEETTDPQLKKCVERLQSSGARMQQIIEELFDLTRARLGGGIPIERKPLDLEAVARKAVAEFEATNPSRQIDVLVSGDTKGSWDAGRLGQVLSNLIGNALRHGTVTVPITVKLTGSETEVVACIQNGGVIAADLMPRLFEPFQSGLGRRTRAEGLGLGLYIVQQIVLAHGGEVRVSSSLEAGTRFEVQLPRG